MSSVLTKEQIEDLLSYLGVTTIMPWKGSKIQFCCPVHGESHPSCGINIDFVPEDKPNEHYQACHCFSCGFSGTIPWLVFKSLPDQFKSLREVNKFLKERYNVSYAYTYDSKTNRIRRYEDFTSTVEVKRFEMPLHKLAPFKSGKETYGYFFERGFDRDDVKKFLIGRDLENETITIPAFWEDGKLAGVIGRYVDLSRPKNSRFKIYEFPKGSLIYPLDKVRAVDDTLIGVESMFDAIMLHKWGFPNAVAMMGDGMSRQQAEQVVARCKKFIALFDHDKGGVEAEKIARKRLGKNVLFLTPTYYPEKGKDPCDWGELETVKIIESAKLRGKIPRMS